jgi:hypothetical protein
LPQPDESIRRGLLDEPRAVLDSLPGLPRQPCLKAISSMTGSQPVTGLGLGHYLGGQKGVSMLLQH